MAKLKASDAVLFSITAFLVGMVVGALAMPGAVVSVLNEPSGPVQLTETSRVTIGIPAVDAEGNGVLGYLTAEVAPGSGQVLLNVEYLTTLEGTQQSARNAVMAAADFTGKDLSNVDVIFNINVNATTIDGPSAGASMAAAVVMALNKETPLNGVMMTGTIDDAGNVGKVGAVLEKAQAAKDSGATVFLVPPGQSQDSQTVRSRQCRQSGRTQVCRVVYTTQPVDISKTAGIQVIEVSTLADVIKHFRGQA